MPYLFSRTRIIIHEKKKKKNDYRTVSVGTVTQKTARLIQFPLGQCQTVKRRTTKRGIEESRPVGIAKVFSLTPRHPV